MSTVLHQIRSNPLLVTLILLVVLAAVPLGYGIPVIGLGLEDEGMARHFDDDEWGLYQAWVKAYTEGPLYAPEFDPFLGYPKLFYNTAGVFLYPYSQANGEDVGAVIATFRSLNIIFGVAGIFVLFFLTRYVFRSNWTAFIAAGLLALTPQFLMWTTNSRPNPLEWLLIFASLFVLVRMCERFTFRLVLWAILIGALAFATKYGALPILILVPLVTLYLIRGQRGDQNRFTEIVQEQVSIYRYLLPVLALLMALSAAWLLLSLRSHDWNAVSMSYNWVEPGIQPWRLPRLLEILEAQRLLVNVAVWGGAVGLVLGAVMAMLVQARLRAWASMGIIQPGIPIYATLFVGLVIVSGVMYTVVFLVTGPAFIAHPSHFFTHVGFEFRYITLGSSFGEGGSPSYLAFFKMVGREFHPGWLAFIPILGYAAYVNIKAVNNSPVQRNQRLVLWGFVLLAVAIYLGSKSAPSLRHILPAVAILYALGADVVVREFGHWKQSRAAGVMAVAMAALLTIGIGMNARESYSDWSQLRFKPQDTGIQVGDWLKERYPEDTRLMTDYIRFYVPPYFTQAANTTTAEWDRYRGPDVNQAVIDWIVSFDPQVLVVSHPQQYNNFVNVLPLLESDPVLKSRNYRLVKEFEYQRPDRQRYEYKRILVYEKGAVAEESNPSGG